MEVLKKEKEMNSRERVLTALKHEEPDRVPIDLGGMISTGISVKAYEKLKEHLGLKGGEIEIYDFFQQLARPDKKIMEKFGLDVYAIMTNPPGDWKLKLEEDKENYSYLDTWGIRYKMAKKGGWCYYAVGHPLAKIKRLEELKDYNWPNPKNPAITKGLREKVKNLYENTNYALLVNSPTGGIFEHSYMLRGFDTLLMDMITNPTLVEAIADKVLKYQIEFWDGVLEEIGEYVQIVQVGDDLGSEQGPLFSLSLYKKFFKHRHKELYRFIKSKTNGYLFLHSCGSVYKFILDFIDNGVQVLNPVQVSAKDMDTQRLKKEFGNQITFWGGGCDTQKVFPFGTPDQVKAEVKKRIEHLAPHGGFVFAQVHNISPEVPPENIVAMLEAARQYGTYPIK